MVELRAGCRVELKGRDSGIGTVAKVRGNWITVQWDAFRNRNTPVICERQELKLIYAPLTQEEYAQQTRMSRNFPFQRGRNAL